MKIALCVCAVTLERSVMICLTWADILCGGVIILVSFQLLNKRIIEGVASFSLNHRPTC